MPHARESPRHPAKPDRAAPPRSAKGPAPPHEPRSFAPELQGRLGPAGDPAEGKRDDD